jgi:hypothetical protein
MPGIELDLRVADLNEEERVLAIAGSITHVYLNSTPSLHRMKPSAGATTDERARYAQIEGARRMRYGVTRYAQLYIFTLNGNTHSPTIHVSQITFSHP